MPIRFQPLLAIFLALLILQACNPDDDEKPTEKLGTIQIEIIHTVNGSPLELDKQDYTTNAGNNYSISKIQYYLSNFSFESKTCNAFLPEQNYHLISYFKDQNWGDPSDHFIYKKTTVAYELPEGCYEQITFGLGVDSVRNSEGPFTGDLDFNWGMNWAWSGDFIFLKHEGEFEDDTLGISSFQHHLGFSRYYQKEVLDFTEDLIIEEGKTTKIQLYVDLGKILNDPNELDLNDAKISTSAGKLARKISDNWASAFSFDEN